MEISYALLAAAAEPDGRGRHNVQGIFTAIRAADFPTALSGFGLFVLVKFRDGESSDTHMPVRISITGGEPLVVLQDERGNIVFEPVRGVRRSGGTNELLARIMFKSVVLPSPGRYEFGFTFNDQVSGRVYLDVHYEPRSEQQNDSHDSD